MDHLHKWRLHFNINTHTSLASHSCENSFVLKHECDAKDVPSIFIQIRRHIWRDDYMEKTMQRFMDFTKMIDNKAK